MSRSSRLVFAASAVSLLSLFACSGGEIAVGRSDQQLQTQKNGKPTGDGTTCSWEGTSLYDTGVSSDGTTSTTTGSLGIGSSFKSLDGCNDCTCTSKGIMCTMRACSGGSSPGNPGGGRACTEEAKQCPDGSYVARTGPNCEFAPCPGTGGACTEEAKQCPDGSYVSRTGPNCEFAPCPGEAVACPADAKQCPDGSYVSRTGPNCEFTPCP